MKNSKRALQGRVRDISQRGLNLPKYIAFLILTIETNSTRSTDVHYHLMGMGRN